MTAEGNSEVLVAIARLDGKLDLALAETAALKAADADHESRIRVIEAKPIPDEETDKRLKGLEAKRTVTPGQLWTGLISVAGLIGIVIGIINQTTTLFGG